MNLCKLYLKVIKKFCINYKLFFVRYMLLFILLITSNLFMYKLQGNLSYIAMEVTDNKLLAKYLVFICVLTLVSVLLTTYKTYLIEKKKNHSLMQINSKLGYLYTKLYDSVLKKRGVGGLTSIVMNDTPVANDFAFGRTLEFIYSLIGVLLSTTYMLYINVFATIIFFIAFISIFYLQEFCSTPIQKAMQDVSISKGEYNNTALDIFSNADIINAYSLEETMEEKYQQQYKKYYKSNKKFLFVLIRSLMLNSLMSNIAIYISYIIIAISTVKGHTTFASFISYIIILEIVSDWLNMIMESMSFIKANAASANRVLEVMDEVCENTSEKHLQFNGAEPIEFSHVSFSYDFSKTNDRKVIDDIDLTIHRGEHIAIIGESGTGKTTIIRLILGLAKNHKGTIRVFGQDVTDNNIYDIRNKISYVAQNFYMFPTTLRENICLGLNVDDNTLINACKKVGLSSLIDNLPNGFDTIVNDGGNNFSGGEKQRILIVRAILQDRSIVLLDEPISALDEMSAENIEKIVNKEFKDKTVVIITHRESILKSIDKTYVMKGGKLLEK